MVAKLYISCCMHAVLGMSSVYLTTVRNPMEDVINSFLNSSLTRYPSLSSRSLNWLWALFNSAPTLGWLAGGMLLKLFTDTWSRKTMCCLVQPTLLCLACLCLHFSRHFNSFELLISGQLILGCSMTLLNLNSVFAVECSPVHHRPTITALYGFGFPLWSSVGAVVGLPQLLGNEQCWHWALTLPMAPALCYIVIGCIFIHDSPRQLYIVQGEEEKSAKALRFYHGEGVNVEKAFEEMEAERKSRHNITRPTLCQIIGSPSLRRPSLLCIAVALATSIGGASYISRWYSTQILHRDFGLPEERAASLSVFVILVPSGLASVCGLALSRLVRRRPFLLGSLVAQEIGLLGILVASQLQCVPLAVCGFALSVWVYVGLVMPFHCALPAELCAQTTRSYAITAQMLAGGVLGTLQAQLYPPISGSLGVWAYAPLCALDIPLLILLFLYLPETKGRTNEEILTKIDGASRAKEEENLVKI